MEGVMKFDQALIKAKVLKALHQVSEHLGLDFLKRFSSLETLKNDQIMLSSDFPLAGEMLKKTVIFLDSVLDVLLSLNRD